MGINRINSDILKDPGFARGRTMPMVDVRRGGQFGHLVDYEAWQNSTQYVSRRLIARLVTVPEGFKYLPNPDQWRGMLKAFIETHTTSISGLNKTLTVNVDEKDFGRAGEKFKVPTQVTRGQTDVSHASFDKYGRPWAWFWDNYVSMLMMDEETGYPNVITMDQYNPGSTNTTYPTDMLPDFYSFSTLYFEPDPTWRHIEKAWYVFNQFPQDDLVTIEGKMDATSGGESSEFEIKFGGIAMTGIAINKWATNILRSMSITGSNPTYRPSFIDGITGDVLNQNEAGYEEGMSRAAKVAMNTGAATSK